MNMSRGDYGISVGIIDGPVDLCHSAFNNSRIRMAAKSESTKCRDADSMSCIHGTFVTGILASKKGSAAPAICPNCEIILRPIFYDTHGKGGSYQFPRSTPQELATAIIQVIDAGATIINLSLGLSYSNITNYPQLNEAYDYAFKKGVIIVAASGNQDEIGFFPIIDHQWIIPVVSCNMRGKLDPKSNTGPSIASRGLMAPGENITSTAPGGGYRRMSGTSFAAPFVTGTIVLLSSLFKHATPAQLVRSIRYQMKIRTIIPPLCDAQKSIDLLRNMLEETVL